jgi:uncharacterized protein YcbK (DUF882 family)
VLLLGFSAAGAAPATPALVLHSTHTQESLTVPPWHDAAAQTAALAAVAHVLRDHRTGAEHPVDPALLDLLVAVASACGVAPAFEVISGYRSPVTNAALHARSAGVSAHSLHMEGRAIDVRLPGCATARLRETALALRRGGVGYYPSLDFVHLDTGRVRRWDG